MAKGKGKGGKPAAPIGGKGGKGQMPMKGKGGKGGKGGC